MTYRRAELNQLTFWIAAIAVLAGTLVFISPVAVPALRTIYEDAAYALDPTPLRAYTYGSKHFDAQSAAKYDLDRAEYFFLQAVQIDPLYPYAQHQLARIAFLRGDFTEALARINLELDTNKAPSPSSYYVRGLILGFKGDYEAAAKDYERYIELRPNNWAGVNDYAWVLLKAKRYSEALAAIDATLPQHPGNPWLLNSKATALYELGRFDEAADAAREAAKGVMEVSKERWLEAYPGNDPLIAPQGIAAFQSAVLKNLHMISQAREK